MNTDGKNSSETKNKNQMSRKRPLILFFASLFLLASALFLAGRHPKLTASDVVAATNKVRLSSGLSELRVSPGLEEASYEKAWDMASQKYFAHESPAGVNPWYWIKKNNYQYLFAGENLAINFSDAQKLLMAWLKSPEHKSNLLNPEYRDIGVSVVNFSAGGKNFTVVVQLFGTPGTLSMR